MEVDLPFKIAITLAEAINMWQKHKKHTMGKIAEKLLYECNLSIVAKPDEENDLRRDFDSAKNTIRNSLYKVISKWKTDKYTYQNCNPHDIFFDLAVSFLHIPFKNCVLKSIYSLNRKIMVTLLIMRHLDLIAILHLRAHHQRGVGLKRRTQFVPKPRENHLMKWFTDQKEDKLMTFTGILLMKLKDWSWSQNSLLHI